MGNTPREVAGCVALPLLLPPTPAIPKQTKHFLYLKPHDPQLPDEDAPRSLFLVNVPVTTTEGALRHLFATTLDAGRVDKVHFADNAPASAGAAPRGRKRKRATAEDIEADLHRHALPNVFDSHVHSTGATAIAVFVDRPGMELSLKAAKRAAKTGGVSWDDRETAPRFGLARYEAHKALQYPSRKELLRTVDGFMTAYAQMEEARAKENARKRQMPDEDGFVTVTRGSKSAAKMDDAKEQLEKKKERDKGLDDFYRFQTRERRKEEQNEMLKKFEEDKRRVDEMRARRQKG